MQMVYYIRFLSSTISCNTSVLNYNLNIKNKSKNKSILTVRQKINIENKYYYGKNITNINEIKKILNYDSKNFKLWF